MAAGRTRKRQVADSQSLSLFESESLSESLPSTEPPKPREVQRPIQPEFLFVERHSTTAGILELEFNWRSRKYQRLKIGDKILAVDYFDRTTLMPLLTQLCCVPTGWRRMYVEESSKAGSP